MKARESGMPDEKVWNQFFDTERILDELEINNKVQTLVEFGFGYGTFTIPASKRIRGQLYAYDIEEDLFCSLSEKLRIEKIKNIKLIRKDLIAEGTGLKDEEADYIILFNILHAEESVDILKEAFRILKKSGKVGIIHWNYDPSTPRGPSMDIRPKPEDITAMIINAGFGILKNNISLPPYHYGILAIK